MKKADISVISKKIGRIDANFGERINKNRWCNVFVKRIYPYSPLRLFYFSLLTKNPTYITKMMLNINAYLNFLMKTEDVNSITHNNYPAAILQGARGASEGHRMGFLSQLGLNSKTTEDINKVSEIQSSIFRNNLNLFWNNPTNKDIYSVVERHKRQDDFAILRQAMQLNLSILKRQYIHASDSKYYSDIAKKMTMHSDIHSPILKDKEHLNSIANTYKRPPFFTDASTLLNYKMRLSQRKTKNGEVSPVSSFSKVGQSGFNKVFSEQGITKRQLTYNKFDVLQEQSILTESLLYRNKVAANYTNSLNLDYLHPSAVKYEGNRFTEDNMKDISAVLNKQVQSSAQKAVSKPDVNVNHIADEVYGLIEKKLRIEKERRGIFR